MELTRSNIPALLQAADYLERRERGLSYSLLRAVEGKALRSVHNELEKHRRTQLRHCLEQLKQQISTKTEHSRYIMLSLLHRARLHIKKLEHQEQKAQQVKEKLRCEQENLHQRLEELQAHLHTEQAEADSLDSSRFSSEHSDSVRQCLVILVLHLHDANKLSSKTMQGLISRKLLATVLIIKEDEVDIEGLAYASIGDVMAAFSTQQEHSYSNVSNFWLWAEAQEDSIHLDKLQTFQKLLRGRVTDTWFIRPFSVSKEEPPFLTKKTAPPYQTKSCISTFFTKPTRAVVKRAYIVKLANFTCNTWWQEKEE